MKIAVYGSASGSISDTANTVAYELGKSIAQRDHVLLTGACPGVPNEAVKGAQEIGGVIVGYSPCSSLDDHEAQGHPTDGFTEFVFVPRTYEHHADHHVSKKYRNVSSVSSCNAAIFVAGQYGTLNEFTLAYDFGKPIGVMVGTGGVSDLIKEISDKVKKEPCPPMIFSSDIEEVLNFLEKSV